MNLLFILTWLSSIAFIFFGINCFTSQFIIDEFIRYNLRKFRKLIGFLQILGAVGLIIGYYYSPILLIMAATGLSILMFAGFFVRIKIKDNFIKSSPSFIFAVINLIIALKAFTKYF